MLASTELNEVPTSTNQSSPKARNAAETVVLLPDCQEPNSSSLNGRSGLVAGAGAGLVVVTTRQRIFSIDSDTSDAMIVDSSPIRFASSAV